ncbi:hypothetical protein [Streptomyces tsukubensis]|uniref:hypothetical protein n=1 Tax=Streptomyces tsukubensis TaxID=83656 RepID=UPI00344C58D3
MTQPRHTAKTITDDALDDLYRRVATAEAVAESNLAHVHAIVPDLRKALARAEHAEAATLAALLLHQETRGDQRHPGICVICHTPFPCDTRRALLTPEPDTSQHLDQLLQLLTTAQTRTLTTGEATRLRTALRAYDQARRARNRR